MLNTININLKTDIKTDRPTTLPIKLMSQDKNNNQFILRFTNGGESVTLDDSYTVEVLTKFTKSGTSRLTTARVRQDYATWEFDTDYIAQDETVYNYVYVRKSGSLVVSADSNAFYFEVGLSEIDKTAGRVAETYDENYEKYLDEFKDVADFAVIQQAEEDRESSESTRKTNETTRISNENARKSAEVIRLASEVDRVNAENVRAEFYEGFDGRLDDLEADKMVLKNMFINGDFSNPTLPPMGPNGVALKMSDGSLSSTITSLGTSRGFYTSMGISAEGDKIYFNLSVKPKHSTNASIGYSNTLLTPSITGGVWNVVSGVSTKVGNSYNFYINTNVSDYVIGDTDMFDNIIVINLTSTFGAGNEPTKSEMDELIKITGYFEEITPTQMQMLKWQLKLMRQNRNALVALGGTII